MFINCSLRHLNTSAVKMQSKSTIITGSCITCISCISSLVSDYLFTVVNVRIQTDRANTYYSHAESKTCTITSITLRCMNSADNIPQ